MLSVFFHFVISLPKTCALTFERCLKLAQWELFSLGAHTIFKNVNRKTYIYGLETLKNYN